jgi:hypothetical protein
MSTADDTRILPTWYFDILTGVTRHSYREQRAASRGDDGRIVDVEGQGVELKVVLEFLPQHHIGQGLQIGQTWTTLIVNTFL